MSEIIYEEDRILKEMDKEEEYLRLCDKYDDDDSQDSMINKMYRVYVHLGGTKNKKEYSKMNSELEQQNL